MNMKQELIAQVQGTGNALLDACGPILSPAEFPSRLLYLPPVPTKVASVPPHVRRYEVVAVRQMHIPTVTSVRLASSIDEMIRQGYMQRDPRLSATWQRIYGPRAVTAPPDPVPLIGSFIGIPGVGKTTAVSRALSLYPQIVVHDNLPGLVGPIKQLVWLRIEMPASGNAADLAEALMTATDEALGSNMFAECYGKTRRRGVAMLNHWLQRVACNFLGILVIDEFNNLFKRQTLKEQRSTSRNGRRIELRVADDETLKFILSLSNSARMPILFGGTPDALEIFKSRASTAQRMSSSGGHHFTHFESPNDRHYRSVFMPNLAKYQWFDEHLPLDDRLAALVHRLTAGVPRLCSLLWYHAHQVAFARGASGLSFLDFEHAAAGPLASNAAAVAALLSNDPMKLAQYQDLIATDDPLLAGFA